MVRVRVRVRVRARARVRVRGKGEDCTGGAANPAPACVAGSL